MGYDSSVKLYYVPDNVNADDQYRIVPAPLIEINPELYYANNMVAGYTFNITLNGNATSIDRSKQNLLEDSEIGFNTTLASVQKIKNLFNIVNGKLIVTDGNKTVLIATGGLTKSINFTQSDNNWVNYAPYTIALEFNEVSLSDNCNTGTVGITCGDIPYGIQPSSNIIDITKYKIKSFNDSWSLSLDNNIYNNYDNISNEYFTISYNISAIGKHYFNGLNLLSSWEQAKNFCQDRLYTQISNLTHGVLDSPPGDGCTTDGRTLASICDTCGNYPALEDIDITSDYGIFNETITINISESDGSAELQYSALIKKTDTENPLNAIHTYSITKNITNKESKIVSYSVDGNIQGLVSGGLIKGAGMFEIPSNGAVIVAKSEAKSSKYDEALSAYSSVGDDNGLDSKFIQDKLKITFGSFGINASECKDFDSSKSPVPTSFTLTHDYDNGIIKYNANFDGSQICSQVNKKSLQVASITIEDPTPMIAEFIIPGRADGPIIQILDINKPRKYTLSIEGMVNPEFCSSKDITDLVTKACQDKFAIDSGNIPINFDSDDKYILTEEKYSKASDGTYNLSRQYIEVDTNKVSSKNGNSPNE